MRGFPLILLLNFWLSADALAAEIEFKRVWSLYDIKGRTYAELRRQLNEVGPVNPDTRKRFDARTDWNLSWDYQYSKVDGKYRLTEHTVKVTATIHFPKWVDIEQGNPLARRLWIVYLNNLKRHEEGHVELAKRAGQTLNTRPVSYTHLRAHET